MMMVVEREWQGVHTGIVFYELFEPSCPHYSSLATTRFVWFELGRTLLDVGVFGTQVRQRNDSVTFPTLDMISLELRLTWRYVHW